MLPSFLGILFKLPKACWVSNIRNKNSWWCINEPKKWICQIWKIFCFIDFSMKNFIFLFFCWNFNFAQAVIFALLNNAYFSFSESLFHTYFYFSIVPIIVTFDISHVLLLQYCSYNCNFPYFTRTFTSVLFL